MHSCKTLISIITPSDSTNTQTLNQKQHHTPTMVDETITEANITTHPQASQTELFSLYFTTILYIVIQYRLILSQSFHK